LGKEAKEIGEAIVVGSLQMLLEKDNRWKRRDGKEKFVK
jgi:hypothetical protein